MTTPLAPTAPSAPLAAGVSLSPVARLSGGDINGAVKRLVEGVLGEIPEVGGLLSGLVALLWPDQTESVWDQIKAQVETLIQQDLDAYTYQTLTKDLAGLQNQLADYQSALRTSQQDPTYISEKYNVALGGCEAAQPHFLATDAIARTAIVLPLMAQFANLHLALLRDGVLFGAQWGWTDEAVAAQHDALRQAVQSYVSFAESWVSMCVVTAPLPAADARHVATEMWRSFNAYHRQMTRAVLDNAFYWPSFDPAVLPPGSAAPALTREIYSDPIGAHDSPAITVGPPPTQPLTGLRVWGDWFVGAVQAAYGGAWGPRMGNHPGDPSGASDAPPRGWNGAVDPANPIVVVSGTAGDVVDSIRFTFADGTTTNTCGGGSGGGGPYAWVIPDHVLSSIKVMGRSDADATADCIVLGFRYRDSY